MNLPVTSRGRSLRAVIMNYDYGKCHLCGAAMEERLTDQSVQEKDEWVLIRSVPTGVCTKCGEQIFQSQSSNTGSLDRGGDQP